MKHVGVIAGAWVLGALVALGQVIPPLPSTLLATSNYWTQSQTINGTLAADQFIATNAAIYEDLRFPPQALNPSGAPSAAVLSSTWGPVSNQLSLDFAASGVSAAFAQVQFPHARVRGTPLHIHLHAAPHTAATGDIVWQLSTTWADIGGVFPTQTVNVVTQRVPTARQWKHEMIDLANGLPMADTNVSAMMAVRFERLGDSTGDTFNAAMSVLELDIHSRVGSLGAPY